MKKLIPIFALALACAAWGSTFFMVKDHVLAEVPAADFLTVRFALASVVACLLWFRELRTAGWKTLALGFGAGVLHGLGQLSQTWGLNMTTAATSGFITAMSVVLVPFVAMILFRERFKPITWLWMLLATLGLAALSLRGWSFGLGELITLLGAVFFAAHVASLGVISPGRSAGALAAMQMVGPAVVNAVPALSDGELTLPPNAIVWADLVYMALICALGTLFVQTWAQARMSSTEAALIMACEPLFATLFSVVFSGEALTWRLLVGGSLIMVAIVAAQLSGVHPDETEPVPVKNHEAARKTANLTGKTDKVRNKKKVGMTS
ncbi:DMT family transporter [Mobiluncus curtisii]|uniref:Putative membrane protein n=1 Tax=Mobiluncus curtisii ATCC 51333 TaxID=887326 RepID=E6LYM6_9ACTO|nr:DMT family transporter [Mobiluncus curtisii]EFU80045.1 putative membrane protein [Mobiluncus curtisii ATCC 51333]